MNKCVLTPDRELMTHQSTDATQDELDEPMNLNGLTGAEMVQRQLHHQTNQTWGTNHGSWKTAV